MSFGVILFLTPVILCLFYFLRQWINGAVCCSEARLDNKVVIITGANTGIGKETSVDLAKRGATVIMACRNTERGEEAMKDVKQRSKSDRVILMILDLASLKSIKNFASSFISRYARLDILINNAGIMMCPYSKTEDGYEMQFGVNHLGHFVLTNLLLPRLATSTPSRIVTVSAEFYRQGNIHFDDINLEQNYAPLKGYCQSKLANVLFTRELHNKLKGMGVTTYSLHPGVIPTQLGRHSWVIKAILLILGPLTCKTLSGGAQTTIYCAVQENIEKLSGSYFRDCNEVISSRKSLDEGVSKKLWEMSESMTGVVFPL